MNDAKTINPEYAVADFGDVRDGAVRPGAVFAFEPKDAFSAGAASQTAMLDRR